jgi:hypothetical protein
MRAIKKIYSRPRLKIELIERADLFKKRDCMSITAHEEMLAVIDDRAGQRVGEGASAPPESRAALKQRDGKSSLAEPNACREPGKPAPDYYYTFAHLRLLNLLSSQILSAT